MSTSDALLVMSGGHAPRRSQRARTNSFVLVGAMERANPLPIGRYWVDVFEKDWAAFHGWLAAQRSGVKVSSTESFEAIDGNPAREWYLFDVVSPVRWEGPGFPTVATKAIKSSADTADRPPPPKNPLEGLGSALTPSGGTMFAVGALGLGLFALVVFLRK